jgi:hypothetical protein
MGWVIARSVSSQILFLSILPNPSPFSYLQNEFEIFFVLTITMTLSTPIKIIVVCFAVAALLNAAMGGGTVNSAGLKGSARKLQFGTGQTFGRVFAGYDTSLINTLKVQAALTSSNPGYDTSLTNSIKVQNALTSSNPGYDTSLTSTLKVQKALTSSNPGYDTSLINALKLQAALTSP